MDRPQPVQAGHLEQQPTVRMIAPRETAPRRRAPKQPSEEGQAQNALLLQLSETYPWEYIVNEFEIKFPNTPWNVAKLQMKRHRLKERPTQGRQYPRDGQAPHQEHTNYSQYQVSQVRPSTFQENGPPPLQWIFPVTSQGYPPGHIQYINPLGVSATSLPVERQSLNQQSGTQGRPGEPPILLPRPPVLSPSSSSHRRSYLPENFLSHNITHDMLRIDQYIASVGIASLRTFERQIFVLLRRAYETRDFFYAALHQIFCLWDLPDRTQVSNLLWPFNEVLQGAFDIIRRLICGNEGLNRAHKEWFARFPQSLEDMGKLEPYCLTMEYVGTFLQNLPWNWAQLSSTCLSRKSLPHLNEFEGIGLLSPVLQGVIRHNLAAQLNTDPYSTFDNYDVQQHQSLQMVAAGQTTHFPTPVRPAVVSQTRPAGSPVINNRPQFGPGRSTSNAYNHNTAQHALPGLGPRSVPWDSATNCTPTRPPSETPLLPSRGFVHGSHPPGLVPCPERTALHQSHLRSPELRPLERFPSKTPEDDQSRRFYQYPRNFALETTISNCFTECHFSVSDKDFNRIPKDTSRGRGQVPIRSFVHETLQYRLRCIKNETGRDMLQVSDTFWPNGSYFQINSNKLEPRRKQHHGQDLPIDITQFIRPENHIKIAIVTPDIAKMKSSSLYVVVEVIEIQGHAQIISNCEHISIEQTRNAIKNSLSSPSSDAGYDLVIVDSNLSIDLIDPIKQSIFEIPVRGKDCLHRECFDLKTFLITRETNQVGKPCRPNVWKCPICNKDARPVNLQIDDFLASVREHLEKTDSLNVKAILVSRDGNWTSKDESTASKGRKTPEVIVLDD